MTTGFFRTGGTLHPDAPSYVTRDADRELLAALERGEFCYILTSRQMGKSSLMARTAIRLRQSGRATVLLDLSGLGKNLTAEQWYAGILYSLGQVRVEGRALGLEDALYAHFADEANRGLGPYRRWALAVERVLLPRCPDGLVLFVDEVDSVLSLPFSTDEFFAGIRELYNRRADDTGLAGLTFCLAGVATPSDLIRDPRSTPFNIGRAIALRDFTESEALALAPGLALAGDDPAALVRRALHWTGGHPYLTQKLCQALVDTPGPVAVDEACARIFLNPAARERDDNLSFVRTRLLHADADVAGLLDLYDRVLRGRQVVDTGQQPLAARLRLSGIVRQDPDGALRPRNRIYHTVFDRAWVRENLPDAELQRQRRAFRHGILRASATFAAVIAVSSVVTWLGLHERAEIQAHHIEFVSQMNVASQAYAAGNLPRALQILERYRSEPEFASRVEWGILWSRCHAATRRIDGLPKNPRCLVATAEALVVLGGDGVLMRRRLGDGASVGEPRRLETKIHRAALSRDGRLAVTADTDGFLALYDTDSGARHWRNRVYPVGDAAFSVALSPDGRRIAAGGFTGTVRLFDTTAGAASGALGGTPMGRVVALDFSPDGRYLAAGDVSGRIRLWRLAAPARPLREIRVARPWQIRFSPDSARLLLATDDPQPRLWEIASGQVRTLSLRHTGLCCAGAFSPRGDRLVTVGAEGGAAFWSVADGALLRSVQGVHEKLPYQAAFAGDAAVVTIDETGSACVLSAPDAEPAGSEGLAAAALAGDGQSAVAIALPTGEPVTLDPRTGQEKPLRHAGPIAVSADGRVALAGRDGGISVGERRAAAAPVKYLAFAPGGRRLLAASADGRVTLRDASTLAPLWETSSGGEPTTLAFSSDGSECVIGLRRPSRVVFRDTRTGAPLRDSLALPADPWCVRYRGDGAQLALCLGDGTVALAELPSGRIVSARAGHIRGAGAASFSPDGRTLATAGEDDVIKLWDTATGQESAVLTELPGPIVDLAFARSGRWLSAVNLRGRMVLLPTVRPDREEVTKGL